MIFHIAFNSYLVFFIFTGAIESILYLLKIRHPRMRYILRSFPLIKLPFDLLYFSFFDESAFVNLNPFSCEIYVKELLANLFIPSFSKELSPLLQKIVPSYLAQILPNPLLNLTVFTLLGGILSLLIIKMIRYISHKKEMNRLINFSQKYREELSNPLLQERIRQLKVTLWTSNEIHIPFATGTRQIFFPSFLLQELSIEEFEAVISHELEHLNWKDPLLKWTHAWIGAIFWWIPLDWWLKRLEAEQEQASDYAIHSYAIEPYNLGSALLKVLSKVKYKRFEMSSICPLDSGQGFHFKRVEQILHSSIDQFRFFSIKNGIALILGASLFAFFWIC